MNRVPGTYMNVIKDQTVVSTESWKKRNKEQGCKSTRRNG